VMRSWILAGLWIASAAVAAACGGSDSSTSASTSGSAGSANAGGGSNGGASASGGAPAGGSAPTGGGDQGGSNANGGGSASGGAGGSSGFCPDSPPGQNQACDPPGKWCSWGVDERYGCRIASFCQDNHKWDRYPVSGIQNCPAPMPACPNDGFDGDCTMAELGLTCVDATHTAYTCTNCTGSLCLQGQQWQQTSGMMLDANCPTDKLPNLGDVCTMEGLVCDYNMCADDQAMNQQWAHGVGITCTGGHWTIWDSMTACI
jgi:hypothetical protein